MSAAVAEGMLAIVKAATEPLIAEVKALRAELAALKAAPPVPGPAGPPGAPGERGEKGDASVVAGPAGADGRDGADAPPPTLDQVKAALGEMTETIAAVLAKYFDAHPVLDGKDGRDGVDGRDGTDGRDGIDGKDGIGIAGKDGRDGIDGKDGVGLAGAIIDRDGALVVTMTDGATKTLGVVVGAAGAPGAPGTDGRDGLGFEDLSFEHDNVGRLLLRFTRGDITKSARVPGLQFREVFKTGESYAVGDVVQWGGDMFVALIDGASLTPGTGAEAAKHWRMAVRRGREGSKGPKGEPGERGAKGDKGDQGPSRW